MKSFFELVKSRKSIRKYKGDVVEKSILDRVLLSGRFAPSGNNSQPWRFIVVDDIATKKKLYEVAGRQSWIIEAPTIVAVVADMRVKMGNVENEDISANNSKYYTVLLKAIRDATIAADHIVMAATDEGLGTCWIALFEQDDIKPILGVPEYCYVVSLITIGYADEKPKARSRKSLSDIVSKNRYNMDPWIESK